MFSCNFLSFQWWSNKVLKNKNKKEKRKKNRMKMLQRRFFLYVSLRFRSFEISLCLMENAWCRVFTLEWNLRKLNATAAQWSHFWIEIKQQEMESWKILINVGHFVTSLMNFKKCVPRKRRFQLCLQFLTKKNQFFFLQSRFVKVI